MYYECYYDLFTMFYFQYMKAIQATIGTSQPIVSESELNIIFYKIPELYNLHANFLDALKRHIQTWDTRIGEHFKMMVRIIFYHIPT